MAIRVFLSFVEEGLALVNLFRAQARNQRLDLEFDDYSIKVSFNSTNADYIGRGITGQMTPASRRASCRSSRSAWRRSSGAGPF